MYYLIYTSDAAFTFQEDDLKALLLQAQAKNKNLGITGMLYYFDGIFIQLIEGQEIDVKQLGNTIANDERHKNFTIIKEGPVEKRFFKEWSMGFKSISPDNKEEVKYFNELSTNRNQNSASVINLFKILID